MSALRIVCQHRNRRTDMQPHGLAYWREQHFKGRDPTVAQLEAKLSCTCKRKAVVTATESWEMVGGIRIACATVYVCIGGSKFRKQRQHRCLMGLYGSFIR